MGELYALRDLVTEHSAPQRPARRYVRYAIAAALAEQQVRDLKKLHKWMRRMNRWEYKGPPLRGPE